MEWIESLNHSVNQIIDELRASVVLGPARRVKISDDSMIDSMTQ
jgi:hypothetical protein